MIRAQGLVKEFGHFRAVDNISFEVQPGEIYGLLGPNGAGKTTTTRLLSCLLQPTEGTAMVAGLSIASDAHAIRDRIGILTEVPGLYLRLTPMEYLNFFADVHGIRGQQRPARVDEVLRLVGMWDRRSQVMRGFSKGMQQRIAIARTLVHDPEVLFFDEPTAALDPEAAKNVRDHLSELTAGRKRTVLLCTHNLPEAELMCRRLSIVHAGRQIAEGTPTQLKARIEQSMYLRLRAIPLGLAEQVASLPKVVQVVQRAGGIAYRTVNTSSISPAVIRLAVAAGADVLGLIEEEASLEDAYLSLVGAAGDRIAQDGNHGAPDLAAATVAG